MSEFFVVGGRQKPGVGYDVDEWHHYAAGLILAVDHESGSIRRCVEYVSPPEACAAGDNPSILFKTGSLVGSRLYVPTQTEILVYDVPRFTLSSYVSLPSFNDVHHVRPGSDGNLLVANTGLDMVLQITPEGRILKEWSTIGEELWTRFSRDVDYRKVVTTKPHRSHPNHVCFINDDVWVTRCDQHDLFCLTSSRNPIHVAETPIHDGLVRGDLIYFTAVNAQVVIADVVSGQVTARYDLNAIADSTVPLGWCRGIEVLDDHRVIVGFSRLRATKWKHNVQWVKHRFGGSGHDLRPTRIAMFDLREERLCWERDLEPAGLNVIFSIHQSIS